MKSPLTLVLGLALASTPASVDPVQHTLVDARMLAQSCESDAIALRSMCFGYLGAISDGVARHQKIGAAKTTVCVPPLVDLESYRTAFLSFVKNNPQALKRQSFEAVKAALEAEWPCSR